MNLTFLQKEGLTLSEGSLKGVKIILPILEEHLVLVQYELKIWLD